MNRERQEETAQVERIERRRPDSEGLSIARRREQVDRIPNAPFLQKAVKACEHCHGHAARESSFNSCRDWIGFEWKQRSGKFWRYRQPFDFSPESRNDRHFFSDLNRLFLLVWDNVAEPSDASGPEQDRSENTDRSARKQPGKYQSDAERKDDGPCCWRWQMDRAWRGFGRFCSRNRCN